MDNICRGLQVGKNLLKTVIRTGDNHEIVYY